MKLSFRWYGEDDLVKLEYIKQIPSINSIVTAIYDVKVGEKWSLESILKLKEKVESVGLKFDVIESLPVHEDIKMGLPTRDKYIENYKENIRSLGKAGIKVICYNFMPIFDWVRTQLDKKLEDGSTSLVCYKSQLNKMNPLDGELSLPGWDSSYTKDQLLGLIKKYEDISEEMLWSNLEYFLKNIIPVAEENNIKMAIHPDDPPYNIFGIPRIIKNEKNIDRLLELVDSEANGITFCTGSLGASSDNNILAMIDKYSLRNRIPFMHVRNIKLLSDGSFEETAHYSDSGSLDIVEILKILYKNKFDGYIRPDHGRMIWGEKGQAGYGLYDRALGAMYITGIWETLKKVYMEE